MKKSNAKGFTLVELVVVIAIIGVLAAILVPSMMGYVKKSRLKTANANAKTAYNAVAEWSADRETQGNPVTWTDKKYAIVNASTGAISGDQATALAGVETVIQDALSDNGNAAGEVAVGGAVVQTGGDTTFFVHWHKGSSDTDCVGQYPEATKDVDSSPSFGTWTHMS